MLSILLRRVIFRSPMPRKKPWMPLVSAGRKYIREMSRRKRAPSLMTSGSSANIRMMPSAPKKQTTVSPAAYTSSMRMPQRKPSFTRSFLPAPRFWAMRVVMAWAMFCCGGVGEVVNAAGGGKGGHGADAHGVHDALHRDLAICTVACCMARPSP